MKRKHNSRPIFDVLTAMRVFIFMLLFVAIPLAGCNLPSDSSGDSTKALFDKNARMYQMYFDSSADPAQNELQARRFLGHLHLVDIAAIFGDIQSLPMDENCNYVGGPVVDDDGLIWYATITADLVGVNLISLAPDGTRSSAFDLDGDRIVDILDMRFSDNRRISFVTELMGLEVFREWLQGRDPFCNTEVARQLGLPDLGCNERGNGPSSGGGGNFAGSGIIDPIAMLCSEYDTGPMSDIMARNPNRSIVERNQVLQSTYEISPGYRRDVTTWNVYDPETGAFLYVEKQIIDTYTPPLGEPYIVRYTWEAVDTDGQGVRKTTEYFYPQGLSTPGQRAVERTTTGTFEVRPQDKGRQNYNENESNPPPPGSSDVGPGPEPREEGDSGSDSDSTWMDRNNPGPEGSDMAVAEFCRNRANHRSGIEQATEQDPTAISVSCGDLVGAPSTAHCNIIEWARPEDFNGIFSPPSDNDGCDTFNDPDRRCEGGGIEDQIRRFVGLNAELWSFNIPSLDICPPIVCNPGEAIELHTYTAGGIEFSCPVPELEPSVEVTPTLVPSVNTCPPGTYYAPGRGRCVQNSQNDGDGGNTGGGCGLSIAACSAQGQSFDQNKCECVDIQ